MKDYLINIFYSDEDKCYVADIPDLKFCSAFGKTPEEALKEVQVAKEAWLEAARDRGKPIPNPRYRSKNAATARRSRIRKSRTPGEPRPHRAKS